MAKMAENTLKNPGKPVAKAYIAGAVAGANAQKKADNVKRVANGGANMYKQLQKEAAGKIQKKG